MKILNLKRKIIEYIKGYGKEIYMEKTQFNIAKKDLKESDLELLATFNPDLLIPFHCAKCNSVQLRIFSTLNSIMICCDKCSFTISLMDVIESLENIVITPPKKEGK